MSWLGRKLRRFRRADDGTSTVEFVIIAPVLFGLVFSVFESGWLLTKYMMLERGLDLAVRDLRLGKIPNVTRVDIRDRVCSNSMFFRDCDTDMIIELTPIDSPSDFPATNATCIDRAEEIEPVVSFNPGARVRLQIMFIRACVVTDPIFPGIGLGLGLTKDNTGGYRMITYSAFVNEPA
ncbi:pilus assembly protein [Abyssibius alkaniclasticus]|uniref:TadE/TadG family type IV pilus assembly protein n=1 Tax=Abyssibius alkaniclasticus TaxID=2881234 RepID=UPI00236464F9|nr:TadE/TadG family type IV pilus assembly protein [Abyssibius alkaniclasticus]UPH70373.1 pilus assembly protein [Abyssibius alkaniclasticus]|tara:strand:+ start:2039 stop:2575 length:537 start_codon:yes stop_codon:yes gene_type:complete